MSRAEEFSISIGDKRRMIVPPHLRHREQVADFELEISTKTDIERFDAMTDDMIDTSEIPLLTDEFFDKAIWRTPEGWGDDSIDAGSSH